MRLKWVAFILVGVFIFLGVSYFYFLQPRHIPGSNPPLKVYRDFGKRFSFYYPSYVKFENNISLGGNIYIATTTDNHRLQVGFGTTENDRCDTPRKTLDKNDNPYAQITEEPINNLVFYKTTIRQDYPDGAGFYIIYRTKKDNLCFSAYEIAYKIDRSINPKELMQKIKVEDFQEDFKILDTMVQSLNII